MKTKTDQIMENIAAWDETQEGKAFRDANDIRNPPGINDDPACVERSLYCSKSSTTVWTNHGEPQPLDDKHFGVAIETEAETETTRQAKINAGKIWQVYPDDDPDNVLFEGSKTACQRFQNQARNVENPRIGKLIWENL